MSSESAFTLTKWYFDGAGEDGRAFIGYWASLAWRSLALTWQDISIFERDGSVVHRSSIAGGAPPAWGNAGLSWRSAALDGSIGVEPRLPPIETTLINTPRGAVTWRAEAPAAMVTAAFKGTAPIRAPGYAECIVMTLAPWHLPIRELRWGRWVDASAEKSLVWIEWRGDAPNTWVFVDGVRAPDAVVSDESVSAGDVRVAFGPRQTLHERSMADVIANAPMLRAALPDSVLALRQSKWCSEAVRGDATGREVSGRAIHEVVVFG